MRVLSIDWDYFIEEDPTLDYGHQESGFFLELAWALRGKRFKFGLDHKYVLGPNGMPEEEDVALTTLLPFRGDEADILTLPCLERGYDMALAESHS